MASIPIKSNRPKIVLTPEQLATLTRPKQQNTIQQTPQTIEQTPQSLTTTLEVKNTQQIQTVVRQPLQQNTIQPKSFQQPQTISPQTIKNNNLQELSTNTPNNSLQPSTQSSTEQYITNNSQSQSNTQTSTKHIQSTQTSPKQHPKTPPQEAKKSVSFSPSVDKNTTQFDEVLNNILSNPIQQENSTKHSYTAGKYVVSRIRFINSKLYDVRNFDINDYYMEYIDTNMTSDDQNNFYNNISEHMFSHAETWKFLEKHEHEFYNNICLGRYDKFFDFDDRHLPLLSNFNNIIKCSISSITDPLRIDGYFRLFDTTTHKLVYNNNAYGDLFSMLDKIVLVEMRKRISLIPNDIVSTWFDVEENDDEYIFKYLEKHGWITDTPSRLCYSIEYIHNLLNQTVHSIKNIKHTDNHTGHTIEDIIYKSLYQPLQEKITAYKNNYDTVMIEFKSKCLLYKKQELIEELSKPLDTSLEKQLFTEDTHLDQEDLQENITDINEREYLGKKRNIEMNILSIQNDNYVDEDTYNLNEFGRYSNNTSDKIDMYGYSKKITHDIEEVENKLKSILKTQQDIPSVDEDVEKKLLSVDLSTEDGIDNYSVLNRPYVKSIDITDNIIQSVESQTHRLDTHVDDYTNNIQNTNNTQNLQQKKHKKKTLADILNLNKSKSETVQSPIQPHNTPVIQPPPIPPVPSVLLPAGTITPSVIKSTDVDITKNTDGDINKNLNEVKHIDNTKHIDNEYKKTDIKQMEFKHIEIKDLEDKLLQNTIKDLDNISKSSHYTSLDYNSIVETNLHPHIFKKINGTIMYKNTIDINDDLFKLQYSKNRYYEQFSVKCSKVEQLIEELKQDTMSIKEKIVYIEDFINNFVGEDGNVDETFIIFIIIYIHQNISNELMIDKKYEISDIIKKWNDMIQHISDM